MRWFVVLAITALAAGATSWRMYSNECFFESGMILLMSSAVFWFAFNDLRIDAEFADARERMLQDE